MFCARCGEQIPDTSEICPLCGREATVQLQPQEPLVLQAAVGAAPAMATPPGGLPDVQVRPINPKLRGIGGWLLFFCVSITILSPMAVMNSIMTREVTSPHVDVT